MPSDTTPSQSPASHAAVVVPSDTTDLVDATGRPTPTRAIYVGGAGNLSVIMVGGETVLLSGVPVGTVLPIRVRRVLAAATTASTIVALW